MTDRNDGGTESANQSKAGETSAEDNAAVSSSEKETTAGPKPVDPVWRLTKIVLGICLVLFIWYVIADRSTPYTSSARVQDYVIPLVARVSGEVIQADLEINQMVEAGDVLVKIDPVTYELKLATAEANLERARQNLRAGTAGLITVEARLREAQAQQRAARTDFNRIEKIYRADPGATAESARDAVRTALETAREKVQGLEADLQRAREQLAAEGDETPEIRSAIADIHQAKIKVKYTTIKAPGPGMVINMKIEEGMYAKEGSSLGTFIPFNRVWIEANFRENSLGNIKAGNPVEIVLDSAPGKVFDGKVVSIGYAVKAGTEIMRGTLAAPEKQGGWLRDAQYFPVIIEFSDVAAAQPYRIVGGQADVIIYTGNNSILNTLGRLWIRLASIFSYVY